MTREEMQTMAWRLIECAKATLDTNRRRVLMQESFELTRQAGLMEESAERASQEVPPRRRQRRTRQAA
jgi:hypothetical protein